MGRQQEYKVKLSAEERKHLINLVSSGVENARKLTRARILLKADEGWTGAETARALDVGQTTVERVRKRYSLDGLDRAINRKPSSREYERKIDGKTEAHLIALVCGEAPAGYAGWTLRLLAEELVALEQVEIKSVSHETVRQTLKKTNLSLGKSKNG
jgi:transposase